MSEQMLTPRDLHYFNSCIDDLDSLMTDIVVKRCIGLNPDQRYPGEPPQIIRTNVYTRAEVKPVPLGEIEQSGGVLIVGDLYVIVGMELRGSQAKNPGDEYDPFKFRADNVADIVEIPTVPYQGEWGVIGVPSPIQIVNEQSPCLWNVSVRRIGGRMYGG